MQIKRSINVLAMFFLGPLACASPTLAPDSGDAATTPRPSYSETSIPSNCDDLSAIGMPPELFTPGNEGASPVESLPFAFPFFSGQSLFYSITTTGYAELYETRGYRPTVACINAAIPVRTSVNGMLAVFWDDLIHVAGKSTLLTATLGAMGARRFVIQWTNWTFRAPAEGAARLTFQAKLFEITNVIEFHYCTLTPGVTADLATGSSATVGIGFAQTGQQHSMNTAMSVSTTSAIRWTPVR